MSDKRSSQKGGISFFLVLTIVLVVLRIVGVISISWIWVLSPLWIPFLIKTFFVFVILGLISLFRG